MTLSIKELTKTYPNGVRALDRIDLEIGNGMFGLLGPNGAGKSSLMRTIATLQDADSGSIRFEGIDVLKNPLSLKMILGYLPQNFGVYPGVSASSLLDALARLKGITSKKMRQSAVGRVLEITNLTEVQKHSVSGYSGGMKQRFGIAQILLNNPRLIIVDEPTAGLDPAERVRFLNVLREVGVENTVLFSTHIVDDVQDLCQDLAIVNAGKIRLHNTPFSILSQLKGRIQTKLIGKQDLDSYDSLHFILSSSYNTDDTLQIRVFAEDQIPNFKPVQPTLEDAYFIFLNQSIGTSTAIIN